MLSVSSERYACCSVDPTGRTIRSSRSRYASSCIQFRSRTRTRVLCRSAGTSHSRHEVYDGGQPRVRQGGRRHVDLDHTARVAGQSSVPALTSALGGPAPAAGAASAERAIAATPRTAVRCLPLLLQLMWPGSPLRRRWNVRGSRRGCPSLLRGGPRAYGPIVNV